MKRLLTVCLLTSVLSTSCMGPNNGFRSLNNWNAKATETDFVNELIYIGLWIIPVYQIAWLGDAFIFNTIDYFGENPITEPGPFPETFGEKSE